MPLSKSIIDVEIEDYLGPLVLFGEGVVLVLRHGDVLFHAHFFTPVIGVDESGLPAQFIIGRRRLVETRFWNDDPPKKVDASTAPGLFPTNKEPLRAPLDVRAVGVIVDVDSEADQALLDCGVPLVINWEAGWELPLGATVEVVGDLRVYPAE